MSLDKYRFLMLLACLLVSGLNLAETGDSILPMKQRAETIDRLLAARFESYAVHCGVNFGLADDLIDLISEGSVEFEVDGFAAEASGLGESFLDHVADDHASGAEEVAGGGASEADGSSARDVDDGAGSDAGGDGAVESCWEDV